MSKPVYLLQGDSLFRAAKIPALLESLERSRGPLQTERLSVSDKPFGEALLRVRNKPFFAKTQVFLFQDAAAWGPEDYGLLESYLAAPADFSVLILEWDDEAEGPRNVRAAETAKKFAALIQRSGGEVEMPPAGASRSSAGFFIRQKLKAAGKTAGPEVLQKLEQEWQDFPALLDTALENLILASGSSSQITPAMAQDFEEGLFKGDRFKLLDAVLARNPGQALNSLARLLQHGGDEPLALVAFFHGQMRLYWQAQRLAQRGWESGKIYSKLGISPRRAHFFSKQMRLFGLKQLEAALEGLFELDRAVKSGEDEAHSGLEKWVVRTAGK